MSAFPPSRFSLPSDVFPSDDQLDALSQEHGWATPNQRRKALRAAIALALEAGASPPSNQPNPAFKRWALGYSGYDGGDPGTPSRPSTWLCGIEWGAGITTEELAKCIDQDNVDRLPDGFVGPEVNFKFPFNRGALKLFHTIEGGDPADYRAFGAAKRPFCVGAHGYFKTNLFPVAFKDISHAHWNAELAALTGFVTKEAYLTWVRKGRFETFRRLAKQCRLRLVACTGVGWEEDFRLAFLGSQREFTKNSVDGHKVLTGRSPEGALVAVVPFFTSPSGLKKDTSIQAVGEFLRKDLLSN